VAWGTSAGTNTQVWFRLYLYVTANPALKQQIGGWTITGGSGFAGSLNLNANGTLRYEDSAFATVTGTTTTNSIATNQWVRLEGFVLGSATVGQYELKLFNSTDSAVPTETVTSTALQNSGGPITGMLFGATPNTANVNYWQDDIGLSSTGYLGPSQIPVSAAQWRQHAGRRKGRRFGAPRSQQQASFVTATAQVLPVIQVSPPEAVQHGATW